tara:strand:+ start:623 stop:952 length:330 start_codon:yes stop_codon:yes gene_type:complete
MRYKIVMKDQSCHYCEDMIEKLNKEYDELYRILKQQEKITKKQNFINCINHINIYSTYLDEMVQFCIDEGDGSEGNFTNNSKNLIYTIKDKSLIITTDSKKTGQDIIMY